MTERTNPTLADLQDEATWLEWRSLIPAASHVTDLVTTEDTRREFLEGARLLRMDKRRRGGDGMPGPSPLQLVIADMLNAGRKFNGIMEPRRATKTTAIQAVILGRCTYREDYIVGWTMAKKDGGSKTAERFRKDIYSHVIRVYEDEKTRPFTTNMGNGTAGIRWPNGSYLSAYAPQNEAFTSGGYDIAWVDEAQDADLALGESLMTSIPPTLDGRFSYTENGDRYGAQMIGSGTAPDYQAGNLLWRLLGMEGAGVLRHGIPQDTDPDELEAWEPTEEAPAGRVRELIELHHPGVGFTTPLSDVLDNWNAMTRVKFLREYLSLAGEEGSATAMISQPKWTTSRLDKTAVDVKLPSVLCLAIAIDPDGHWCSLAAAWKGKEDKRHVALLHHQSGVQGFAAQVVRISAKLRRRVLFDPGRPTENVEITPLNARRSVLQVRPLQRHDIPRAAVLFMKTLNAGNLVHYAGQDPLDGAAEIAVRRAFGVTGAWAFGRPDEKNRPEDDITPLEAASRALYGLDDEKAAGVGFNITGV